MKQTCFRHLSMAALLAVSAFQSRGATPVILSTDVGNEIDDQWAIAYMMTNPAFEVKGMISAQAPSLPDPSAHATFEILTEVIERRLGMAIHPPLFEGSSSALPNRKTPLPNAGVQFMIETSKSYSSDNRLTVLTIGAATDIASAILTDPAIADRIRVVAMAFTNREPGTGSEFNVANDLHAWQAILDSRVPVVIGSGEVCKKYLSLGYEQAREMVAHRGAIGTWLWEDYRNWYFRNVKPLRVNDYSKPWVIWDTITLAYVLGLTSSEEISRPELTDELNFRAQTNRGTITWITTVDSKQQWNDFTRLLDEYQRTHATPYSFCNSKDRR